MGYIQGLPTLQNYMFLVILFGVAPVRKYISWPLNVPGII
jgi:hypothetical protein